MTDRKIKVYSKSMCAPCNMTKRTLTRNNVDFEEINIEMNEDAMSYVKSKGHKAAPVVEVWDGDILSEAWSGLHPDKLNSLFA